MTQIGKDLYKRAANGAIRKWSIFVENDEITRISGQLGGTYTTYVDDTIVGKNIGRANETTPEQQAILEAESLYKKQLDNGYKAISEVEALNLPKYNTDANGNIKPMLAKKADLDKIIFPVFIQPKLDGVRCLMIVKDSEVSFLSRSGKSYTTLSHIENDVLFSINKEQDFRLDGEGCSEEITFQESISAVKAIGSNSKKLKFRCYDIVNDYSQSNRLNLISTLVNQINSKHVIEVETKLAYSKIEVMTLHNLWVEEGNEGAMIRKPSGLYKQGARSSDLLKVKVFDEEEFFVTDIIQGKRAEDLIAVCHTANSKEFKAKLVGPMDYKAKLWLDWKDQEVEPFLTVKYFGLTDDEIPRFPIGKAFRDYE